MKQILAILLLCSWAFGANHYILPSGAGGNTGADWSNACNGFSGNCAWGSMVRGDTYFVGGNGHYAGNQTINVAASGTTLITVKGATATDHGTATGWSSAFGVDVNSAIFDVGSCPGFLCYAIFRTPYYVIDGNYLGTQSSVGTYGFILNAPSSCVSDYHIWHLGDAGGEDVTHITIAHFGADFSGCGSASVTRTMLEEQVTATQGTLTFSHNFCNGCQTVVNTRGGSTGATLSFNYNINPFSDSTHHGNFINLFAEGSCTISNNVAIGINGTGGITAEGPVAGCAIYGNILEGNIGGNNGVITATTGDYWQSTLVYNNTFAANSGINATFAPCLSADAACTNATGNVFENNLVWNQACALTGGGTVTDDYNSYLSCTDTAPTETHGQVVSLNPFVSSGTNNFNLAGAAVSSCASTSAICGGLSLSAPYRVDANGISRGSFNGQWERGAFAFSLAILNGSDGLAGATCGPGCVIR